MMMLSDFIAELQRQLDVHGDRQVGVVMNGAQRQRASVAITNIWPLTVSDRSRALVIECAEMRTETDPAR